MCSNPGQSSVISAQGSSFKVEDFCVLGLPRQVSMGPSWRERKDIYGVLRMAETVRFVDEKRM